jgi:hypothetical protein
MDDEIFIGKDPKTDYLLLDISPDAIWWKWIASPEDISFGDYVRKYHPEKVKEE